MILVQDCFEFWNNFAPCSFFEMLLQMYVHGTML